MTNSPACPRCSLDESGLHALRDCSFVQGIWRRLGGKASSPSFYNTPMLEWMQYNMTSEDGWVTTFGNMVWLAWKQRNRVVFDNGHDDPDELLRHVREASYIFSNELCRRKEGLLRPPAPAESLPSPWSAPSIGWKKLNTDGASGGTPIKAGGGGILRSPSGDFIWAFSCNFGACSALRAELMAIHKGLELCQERGCNRTVVETDCLEAVKLLSNELPLTHPDFTLLEDCSALLRNPDCEFSLLHTPRQNNRVADSLAKLSLLHHKGVRVYDTPPASVISFIISDAVAMARGTFRFNLSSHSF